MQNVELKNIEQFWGSLEAYNEEQRRCGMYQLEAVQIEKQGGLNFRPNLFGNTPRQDQSSVEARPAHRTNFHFFGHKA